jgi:CheY-like chemotaxis protein
MRPNLAVAKCQHFPWRVEPIDGRKSLDRQPEHRGLFLGAGVQKEVVFVKVDWHVEHALRDRNARHMIHVGMSKQNVTDSDLFPLREREKGRRFVTGVNQDSFPGAPTGDNKAILEERRGGLRLDYDHVVILAILDDLMFTSKIKTAASRLGVPIAFARSATAALADMRNASPTLVILDLNNPRTDPLGIVVSMKADPALSSIPTLGFVSHVHTELINAAREAGVGEVVARSAFSDRLPEILERAR